MITELSKPNLLLRAGVIIVGSGILVYFANEISFDAVMKAVGVLHIIAGFFSFMFAAGNKRLKFGYLSFLMQGLARVIYGCYLLFFVKSPNDMIIATSIFALFYAFFDIFFGLSVLTENKFNLRIVIFNLLSGLLNGIIGVLLLIHMVAGKNVLPVIALLMVGAGIFSILFIRSIKDMTLTNRSGK